ETLSGPLSVRIGVDHTEMTTSHPLGFMALIDGKASLSVWDFADGTVLTNQAYTSHTWSSPGDYLVTLTAFNDTWPSGTNATITIHVIPPPIHYVSLGNANPQPPYTSWTTAATNIQDAVDAAILPGASVLVSNGIYATGSRVVFGGVTNRIAI